jgi:hypothetical protein
MTWPGRRCHGTSRGRGRVSRFSQGKRPLSAGYCGRSARPDRTSRRALVDRHPRRADEDPDRLLPFAIKPEAVGIGDDSRMDCDWTHEREVRFGGHDGALTVYLGLGCIGVLISREVRIECGPLDGRVRGWFDFDPDAVRRELRSLLARRDLTGHVRLTGAEHGEFGAVLDLDHGRGVISATVKSRSPGWMDAGHSRLQQTRATSASAPRPRATARMAASAMD